MRRLVMAMTMLKYGLMPIVFQKLSCSEYISAVVAFQNGQTEALYDVVAETVDTMLLTHLYADAST